MNVRVLEIQLNNLNVRPSLYSLHGEELPDSIVLLHNYDQWEVFYFSERGTRHDERTFDSESKVCEYIYMNCFMKILFDYGYERDF